MFEITINKAPNLYTISLHSTFIYLFFIWVAVSVNLTLYGPYIVIYLRTKNQPDALSF